MVDGEATHVDRKPPISRRIRPAGLRLPGPFLLVPGIILLLIFLLPFAVVITPVGQRHVERLIEAPLLARLEAAAPAPFSLRVDSLRTRIGGATLQVDLVGAELAAPGLKLSLANTSVRLRYVDILRGNPIPDRITVQSARFEIDNLAPMRTFSAEAVAANAAAGVSPSSTQQGLESPDGVLGLDTPEVLASLQLDGLVNAFDALDQALTDITVGSTWQSLRSIDVEELSLAPRPNAGIPFLRNPDTFGIHISRQSSREMTARIETIKRANPITLIVRHAEAGAPQGPATLASIAGTEIGEDQAFSHMLLHGLSTSDLTDAFEGDGPVVFQSYLAAEIVATRAENSGEIEQIIALFESDAGYLIASQREATILESASIPMIYTRESGRFDIISARLEFQDTGGVFGGTLAPGEHGGEQGLILSIEAPQYRLTVPAEPALGRQPLSGNARVAIDAFFNDRGDRVDITSAEMAMGDVLVAFAGSIEKSADGPVVSLVGQSTPMRAQHLAAMWPLPLSPEARNWFLGNVAEAQVGPGTFSFAARLNDIGVEDGRALLDDEMLRLSVPYENLVLRTIGELPPVFGVDGTITVTGRTVHMEGEAGVGRLETGETIELSRADFFIADHSQEEPLASLQLDLSGPASGFANMAFLDPLELDDQIPFSPSSLSGNVDMTARIDAVLADEIDRDAVEVEARLQVSDFASSEPIDGRTLEGGTFLLATGSAGTQLVGRGRLDGVMTEFDFTPDDGGGMQIAMQLDDEDRRRVGLDFGRYLTGTIGVDLGDGADGNTQLMTIDLTDAVLSIAELGWSKPSGVPGRASFEVIERDNQRLVRNLVIAAEGLAARGSLDFVDGELRAAEFESVAIDGIGRFSLELARNSQATTARLSGDSFVLKPDLLRGDPDDAGVLSIDIDVGELITQGGERLTDVSLAYAQDLERITRFELRARHSDGTDLVGTLSPNENANNIVISSGNAGTFLRLLGLYQRAEGGRATLVLDTGSVGGRVAGRLLLSDYLIVNEPAMERIFSSGRDQARNVSNIIIPGDFETSDRIEIQVTNIAFDRTPERLIIHRAEGWGPSLGGNLEGTIDYAANRIQLRGTYVPLFTINNVFSRIPLLGQVLGGRNTEGLLGITFQLIGAADAPRLEVNPMSLLAPGVFRNIFEFQQGG